jgi:ABC-type lipoprotein release transport system permease subunit
VRREEIYEMNGGLWIDGLVQDLRIGLRTLRRQPGFSPLFLIGAGIACGLLASVALTRLISDLLYDITPLDVPTFAAVTLLLFAVACVASYLPARRATRIDPVTALRCE